MARLLLLTPQFPYPPWQGTTLRNYHILRWLADHHEVTLLSAVHEPPGAALEAIRQLCQEVRTAPAASRSQAVRLRDLLASELPDLALRVFSPEYDVALAALLRAEVDGGRPFDVVQVEGLELGQAVAAVRRDSPTSRIVLDEHNAETELQRRALARDAGRPGRWIAAAYSLAQLGRLRRFEAWACATADAVTAVSEQDAEALRRLAPEASITVIPNFIDVQQYAGGAADTIAPSDLAYTGKMDYRPNVDAVTWFAREVWPAVRASRPGTTLAIVGQRPSPVVQRLGRLAGITVTGAVEAVQPYLNAAAVYVAPVRMASGTRLKLLEAMASGRAIVSTSAGREGFPVVDGRELVVADRAADFAAAIVELLADPDRREALGAAAREFAAGYDWRDVVPRFAAVYEPLLRGEGSAPSDSGSTAPDRPR